MIEIPITKTERGLGFIDDFSAWVVGKSVSENLERIENEVITRVVQWAQAIGATFEKTKTELIHFTRNLNINPRPYQAIRFEDSYITPQDSLKLLGVILDKQLRMKEHVSNAASKAISRCLAIKRLRGIKSKATACGNCTVLQSHLYPTILHQLGINLKLYNRCLIKFKG